MKFNFISVKNTKLFLHDYKTPGSTAGKDQWGTKQTTTMHRKSAIKITLIEVIIELLFY